LKILVPAYNVFFFKPEDSQYLRHDLKPVPPEYRAGMLPSSRRHKELAKGENRCTKEKHKIEAGY
jgi:hypothetical protein